MRDKGFTLFECVISLGIGSLVVTSTLIFHATMSRSILHQHRHQQGRLAATKVTSAIVAALRALERNRLPFAASIVHADGMTLPNGAPHPLGDLPGTSAPRSLSDILSIVDIAPRYKGRVVFSTISGSSVDAEVCGLAAKPRQDQFTSFLLISLDGARQIVGDIHNRGDGCISISGSIIRGLVSNERTFASKPFAFFPIEREYSLFIDRTGNLRIVSHVGDRITENQPIVRGLFSIRLSQHHQPGGGITFNLTVQPSYGSLVRTVIVPALTRRSHWSEVLP